METTINKPLKDNNTFRMKKKEQRIESIYHRSLITRTLSMPITEIGKNLKETIERKMQFGYEGKCIVEGYVKPNSIKVLNYSSGLIERGNFISFEVVFECQVCFPVEGTIIQCEAKNITKAGIRAESAIEKPSPIVVFVARDHHYNNTLFNSIQEGDKFNARIIGQRFELYDTYVSIIAEIVPQRSEKEAGVKGVKPRLVLQEETE